MNRKCMVRKGMSLGIAAVLTAGTVGNLSVLAAEPADETTQIVNLKTDGLTNPLGIDTEEPCFSWQMASSQIGIAQASYQITVEDESGEVVWDSGVVEEGTSTEVKYAGEELRAQEAYTWRVSVTDEDGNCYESDPATFETALMSTDLDAWDGAQWIGADELTLDAASACYFHIRTDVQIPEGSGSASMIFGADDFRMNNPYFNVDLMSGEHYVRAELNISDVTEEGGAVLNIYRVGFFDGDSAEVPFAVVSAAEIPDTNLDELITEANKNDTHTIDIEVCASDLTISIDGTEVITGTSVGFDGSSNPSSSLSLCDLGSGGDYNTYPNLNSIGFYADAGETAVFSNYELLNVGYGTGVLFDETTGATTEIFNGLDGITVDGSEITVEGGADGILSYADPSYGSSAMVRTDFTAEKEIASARLYVSAQGIYEVSVNGEKVGEDWFNPGNTEYREEIAYQTYDITDLLVTGGNAIGAQLGSGWWNGYVSYTVSNYNYYGDQPALLAKIYIEYTDGTEDVFVTDDTWQYYGDGPVVYDSFFNGERYDATREAAVEGFSEPGFEAEGLRNAAVIETRETFSDYKLVTRFDEPARVVGEVEVAEALGESREGSGSYIYDMGENVNGVPQITIPAEYAEEGTEIIIRYAEMLYPDNEEYVEENLDGLMMVENLRAALCTDFYTASGEDDVFEPHFTCRGYRYIEITGLKEELPAEYIKTLVLSSQETTATYESSNELTNRLFENIQNSQTSNYLSLPTDCPQRNERMGWMGDAQIFSLAASYNSDIYNFMRQWLDSVRAEQSEDGNLPVYAPSYDPVNEEGEVEFGTMFWDGTSWKCAIVNIPYNMYLQFGRTEIIEDNIDAMYGYIKYLDSNDFVYTDAEGNTVTEPALTDKTGFLADWLSRVSTDATLINNAVYVSMLERTAMMAEVIGRTDMAEELNTMYEEAKAAWNRIYIDGETGLTKAPDGTVQNTQASYATALSYGVVADDLTDLVAANFEKTVSEPEVTTDDDGVEIVPYTLTTGFSGTPNLLPALTMNGYIDTAYALFESTDYASWLYPVTQGATSVWERWNSYTIEGGFNGNNSMNSFNHFSLGAVSEWMMAYQLGIASEDAAAGYKEFILQPTVGGTFTYAGGTFESPYGTIESRWTADEDGIASYEATVPANTSATLYLPTDAVGDFADIEGVTFEGMTEHNGQTAAEFTLLSGSYEFTISDGNVSVISA